MKKTKNSSRKLSSLLLLSIVLFSVCAARAQNTDTSSVDAEIQKLLDENKIPALGIGVIKGGKLTEVSVMMQKETLTKSVRILKRTRLMIC